MFHVISLTQQCCASGFRRTWAEADCSRPGPSLPETYGHRNGKSCTSTSQCSCGESEGVERPRQFGLSTWTGRTRRREHLWREWTSLRRKDANSVAIFRRAVKWLISLCQQCGRVHTSCYFFNAVTIPTYNTQKWWLCNVKFIPQIIFLCSLWKICDDEMNESHQWPEWGSALHSDALQLFNEMTKKWHRRQNICGFHPQRCFIHWSWRETFETWFSIITYAKLQSFWIPRLQMVPLCFNQRYFLIENLMFVHENNESSQRFEIGSSQSVETVSSPLASHPMTISRRVIC